VGWKNCCCTRLWSESTGAEEWSVRVLPLC
jgi:hypothetical protein